MSSTPHICAHEPLTPLYPRDGRPLMIAIGPRKFGNLLQRAAGEGPPPDFLHTGTPARIEDGPYQEQIDQLMALADDELNARAENLLAQSHLAGLRMVALLIYAVVFQRKGNAEMLTKVQACITLELERIPRLKFGQGAKPGQGIPGQGGVLR